MKQENDSYFEYQNGIEYNHFINQMIKKDNGDSTENKVDQQDEQEENVPWQQQSQSTLVNNQMQKLELMKKCGFQNLLWVNRPLQEQDSFLMFGDLLIEINKYYNDIDYTSKICNLYLKKKRIVWVNYDKINHLIEMQSENKCSGQKDFNYIQTRLTNSQSQQNLMLAQQLNTYEQKMHELNIKYENFFKENDENVVRQVQQDFYEKMRKELVENIMTNEVDFYSYLFYSYIDKNEMGYPIQKQQGINEASCALFGCDATQLVELMQRYGFVEQILKRGFSRDIIDYEPFSHIFMMQNQEYFSQQSDLFDEVVGFMTVDGIHAQMKMIIKQISLKYKGVLISNFYYTRYILENSELERILSIRYSGSNIYSSENILDILLNQTIYSLKANQFGDFISNHKNFQPPANQDLYPEKTCKYKLI